MKKAINKTSIFGMWTHREREFFLVETPDDLAPGSQVQPRESPTIVLCLVELCEFSVIQESN